ncbi:CBS domain-containing protein [Sutterella sp.]|uniref:CBS domain-containing protein n=1 Tax=Sutterella sp. TaxID=1981025 RepID=UPI0026E0A744|nr:CBS domain-containing protein [Sutterella sp.]MDO5532988.1 CBS domain-containing protein [Sutterella sp.]
MRTRSLKVIDMAVHQVATIGPEKTILECASQMRREHVGSLVVTGEDNRPLGMITDRDITIEGVARGLDLAKVTVADLMTTPVVTSNEREGMVTALARMRENGIRRLPIVDDTGRLVGVLTSSNLIKELSALLDSLVRTISSSKTREIATRSDD